MPKRLIFQAANLYFDHRWPMTLPWHSSDFTQRKRKQIPQLESAFPFAMRSHVVYKYNCKCSGALYVGETGRHINTRISEQWFYLPKVKYLVGWINFPLNRLPNFHGIWASVSKFYVSPYLIFMLLTTLIFRKPNPHIPVQSSSSPTKKIVHFDFMWYIN